MTAKEARAVEQAIERWWAAYCDEDEDAYRTLKLTGDSVTSNGNKVSWSLETFESLTVEHCHWAAE